MSEQIKKIKTNAKSKFNDFDQISKGPNAVLVLLFAIVALACVIPVIFLIAISISSEASIKSYGYQFIPKEFSIEAYKFLWENRKMLIDATVISLIVTVVGTAMGVLLTTSMGYVLSRKEYKLNTFMTWLVFIPMIFNGGLISTYFINRTVFNLGDNIWALILPLLVSSFNVVICRTFFRTTIPDSIIESAKIDGASQFRIYFGIVVPISLPIFATIALFLIFAYWNDWWQAMLYINKPSLKPLQSLLMSIEGNIEYMIKNASSIGSTVSEMLKRMPRESFRMAVAVVIIAPVAIAYPFFQRYFISGLTVGAVKG